MRIWSLHPKYLDTKGLVALWREALLAKHVLLGKTKGYRNHPQLIRFRQARDPLAAINRYLAEVHAEATRRGFSFQQEKFDASRSRFRIPVSQDQVAYEFKHLMNKLRIRDKERYEELKMIHEYEVHPLFSLCEGKIATWEKR